MNKWFHNITTLGVWLGDDVSEIVMLLFIMYTYFFLLNEIIPSFLLVFPDVTHRPGHGLIV